MALKIQLFDDPVTGEKRVPAEVMDLLKRLAEHRDLCSTCSEAMKSGSGRYCTTGAEIVIEVSKQPGIQFTPEE